MRHQGTVLVVQPYIPRYRVPLFDSLAKTLADTDGLTLVVAHGSPAGHQAQRDDSAGSQPWSQEVPEWRVGLPGGKTLRWRHLAGTVHDAAAIVCPLANLEISTWVQAFTRPKRLIVWGHGKSFTGPARAFDDWLEAAMARRAAYAMTYSESGRLSLINRGVMPSRVIAVGNSTDTQRLRAVREELGEQAGHVLAQSLGLPPHPVAFVGGLDESKRIGFMLEAAAHAHRLDPQFCLIIAGAGQDEAMVRAALGNPWLRWMPSAGLSELAALGSVAESMWMPGRVGLVAVDAIALRLPVLTTSFPYHAPEFEYLLEGTDVFTLPDDSLRFAEEACRLTAKWRATDRPSSATIVPSVAEVAGRMAATIGQVARSARRPQK